MIVKLKATLGSSILLISIVAPYLLNAIQNSLYILPFLWLIMGLTFIEFVYKKLSILIMHEYEFDINIIIIPSLILIFYFKLFIIEIKHTKKLIPHDPDIIIIIIYFLFILMALVAIFYWISAKFNGIYLFINCFTLIFTITTILTNPLVDRLKGELEGHFIPINVNNTINVHYAKPIILLILDEYASPEELYKNHSDSAIFHFNNTLISDGWKVSTKQYSYNLNTVNSLSSLFNYNFKLQDSNLKVNYSLSNLRKAKLINDLNKKGVLLINYSIFNLSN
jgi:hypothetical protein